MTTSLWSRLPAPQHLTPDAVVVGAGIAGLSAALHLERRGQRVLLLERHTVGSGASSRNAGFLMRGAADNYAACIREHGRDRARLLWKLTEDNQSALRAEGAAAIPTYAPRPSCLLALTDKEAHELRESARLLREDGFDAEWRESGDDAAWKSNLIRGALLNPSDASISPVALLRLLVSKLKAPPLENSEVHAIEPDDSGVTLRTPRHTIRAKCAVICTNAYAGLLLPDLARLVKPNRGQMLAFKSTARIDCCYYANHGGEYFRRATDDTVIVGGWRRHDADNERTYDDRTTDTIQRGLESFIAPFVGHQPTDITARWAGTMGFTPDHLPIADAIDPHRRLYFCGGFSGQGMSMGFRTAALTVEAALDGPPTPFPISRFPA